MSRSVDQGFVRVQKVTMETNKTIENLRKNCESLNEKLKQELGVWISDLTQSVKKNEEGLAETDERVNRIERKVEKFERKDDDATKILKHYDQKIFWENAVMVKGCPNREKALEIIKDLSENPEIGKDHSKIFHVTTTMRPGKKIANQKTQEQKNNGEPMEEGEKDDQNENEGGEKPKRKYVGTKFKLSKEDYQRVMARKSGLKKNLKQKQFMWIVSKQISNAN